MADALQVEVVYARPERQEVVRLELAVGSTVEQAVLASGLLERHPEISLAASKFGIFGAKASRLTPLRSGDRVEIYRPLLVDPRESRRRRAAKPRPA